MTVPKDICLPLSMYFKLSQKFSYILFSVQLCSKHFLMAFLFPL